jgi:uncharacterized protein with PQ loop repeat
LDVFIFGPTLLKLAPTKTLKMTTVAAFIAGFGACFAFVFILYIVSIISAWDRGGFSGPW